MRTVGTAGRDWHPRDWRVFALRRPHVGRSRPVPLFFGHWLCSALRIHKRSMAVASGCNARGHRLSGANPAYRSWLCCQSFLERVACTDEAENRVPFIFRSYRDMPFSMPRALNLQSIGAIAEQLIGGGYLLVDQSFRQGSPFAHVLKR
jgi:hypothetical protein